MSVPTRLSRNRGLCKCSRNASQISLSGPTGVGVVITNETKEEHADTFKKEVDSERS
jgi:hypothetical protein